jgi:chorismate mutase
LSSINELRKEIENIDEQIILFISKRINVAKRIGLEKQKQGLSIINKNIEDKVLKRNTEYGLKLGLDKQLLKELTYLLIRYSIRAQNSR